MSPRKEMWALPTRPMIERYIRFGPFQVDQQRQEVTKGGSRLMLQGKVYQVLLALLEKQGEVVTREEIRALVDDGRACQLLCERQCLRDQTASGLRRLLRALHRDHSAARLLPGAAAGVCRHSVPSRCDARRQSQRVRARKQEQLGAAKLRNLEHLRRSCLDPCGHAAWRTRRLTLSQMTQFCAVPVWMADRRACSR
jgi:hypothetical protein